MNSIPAYPMWLIVVVYVLVSAISLISCFESFQSCQLLFPSLFRLALFPNTLPSLSRLPTLPGLLLPLHSNILESLLLYASIIYKRSPGERVLHTFPLSSAESTLPTTKHLLPHIAVASRQYGRRAVYSIRDRRSPLF